MDDALKMVEQAEAAQVIPKEEAMNLFKICTAAIVLVSFNVHAALVDITDHGDYLSDTSSGLDWLDVTETWNMSAMDVWDASRNHGTSRSGYDLSEWRHASLDELIILFYNTTGVAIDTNWLNHNLGADNNDGPADIMISLLGDTYHLGAQLLNIGTSCSSEEIEAGLCYQRTKGTLYRYGDHGIEYLSLSIQDEEEVWSPFAEDRVNIGGAIELSRLYIADPFAGHWLVRNHSSVPEPTTLTLIGRGLAGIGFARKKKQL